MASLGVEPWEGLQTSTTFHFNKNNHNMNNNNNKSIIFSNHFFSFFILHQGNPFSWQGNLP